MKSRKMWAYPTEVGSRMTLAYSEQGGFTRPVLVTDATGMPDFKPGDRVHIIKTGEEDVVDAHPFRDKNGDWRVPLFHTMRTHRPCNLAKLPRERTVTITVTRVAEGSKIAREIEETVEGWQDFYGISIDVLERVEDPDAKAER